VPLERRVLLEHRVLLVSLAQLGFAETLDSLVLRVSKGP